MNIFTKEYWQTAASEFADLKKLLLAAVFCALTVVLEKLELPILEGLQVQFTFITIAFCSAVCGPLLGMAVAGAADTIYALLLSPYAYFPGYLLNKLMIGMIFGLFLYRQKVTVGKLFWSKLLMNFPINVGLGAFWMRCITGKAYVVYFWPSLWKNMVLLPAEVLLIAGLFAALLPAAAKRGLLPTHSEEQLKSLRMKESLFPILCAFSIFLAVCAVAYGYHSGYWGFYLLGGGLAAGALVLGLWNCKRKKSE